MTKFPLKRALPQAVVVGIVLGLAIGALTQSWWEQPETWSEAVIGGGDPARQEGASGTLVALRARSVSIPAPETNAEPIAKTVEVRSGDTLMGLLSAAGIPLGEAQETIKALRPIFNPRAIKEGQRVELTFAPTADSDQAAPNFQRLLIPLSFDLDVSVERTEAGFVAREIRKELEIQLVRMGGGISSSLIDSAQIAGVPKSVLFDFIRLYSFDIDFQRDLHPGDRFEIAFERYYDDTGRSVAEGKIQYAVLTLNGREHRLYRFEHEDGSPGYYNEKGESVQKALMRTPVDGARLSSRYGPRRHPILGYTRMHRGLDFAAPTGTPVMAAGSGVVEMAGRNSGYGNYVRIRHNSEYSTAYAHLSRFARGIRVGKRVEQGDIIGYVGSTGLSTGPHLHYEVLHRGRQINPLTLNPPTERKLEGRELEAFRRLILRMDTEIAALPLETRVASRE